MDSKIRACSGLKTLLRLKQYELVRFHGRTNTAQTNYLIFKLKIECVVNIAASNACGQKKYPLSVGCSWQL